MRGSYKIPPDLSVSGRFTNPGQVDVPLFQVFPDIAHPGLPLLLFPSTCPCKAAFGNLFSSILSTCPNHCSLLFLIFCTTVSSAPSSSFVCSFLTFSLLLLPLILLSQLISATNSLLFLRHQHSE